MQAQDLTRNQRRSLCISVGLFWVTFGVFARVLRNDFVCFDDDTSVYQNPHVQGLDWVRLWWMFSDVARAVRYKPLTWLSYGVIYKFSGLNPLGYHLASLLFHCLNAALMFVLIRRLLALAGSSDPASETQSNLTLSAALAALLWAVNPLRVEPVARVTDLTYGQSFFFLLLSLWFYLPAAAGPSISRPRRLFYWCSLATFALSMLSYPFACGYVLVLAALDWYPLRRLNWATAWWQCASTRRIALQKVPFLLLGGLLFATYLARVNPPPEWAGALLSTSHLNPLKQAVQAGYVCIYYVWKPWLPFYLSPFYNTLFPFNPRTWPFWASVALVAGISLVLWWKRRQLPGALALWLCHLALLLAALGLTERAHHPCDRYAYVPGLVWAVGVAAVLWKLPQSRKLHVITNGCVVCLALFWAGLSVHQIRIWKNSEVLFEYMLGQLDTRSPYRNIFHGYLGIYYTDQGRFGEAVRQYQTSLRIAPSLFGYYRLGTLLETNGAVEGALTNYLSYLELHPSAMVHARAAHLLAGRGRTAEAIRHYREALSLSPNSAPALDGLAWILATSPVAAYRNGFEAVQLAERACEITHSEVPEMVGTLAAAYAEAGLFATAIETGERACAAARAAGEFELARRNQELLALYRAGQPCRQVPGPASASSDRVSELPSSGRTNSFDKAKQ